MENFKTGCINESNKEYHEYKNAISKSRLSKISVCPQYFKWCEDNPQEPTQDLIFGSAFHKVVLEPETFDKEFSVLPNYIDRRTKAGKEEYADFLLKSKDKSILTQEDFDTILAMRNAVFANQYADVLLKGIKEQSLYFLDDLTNMHCKVRPDCQTRIKNRLVIVDLKSCKSACPEDFMRDVVKYSYDLQMAMYKIGVSKTLGIDINDIDFVFIAVEKKAPYLVGIYEAGEDIFNRGEMLYRKYLGILKQCIETNDWYSYNGFTYAPIVLNLPEYLTNKKNDFKGD